MDISLFSLDLIVFVLSCFVGYYVIWGVTPALHTPLMAVTNAISGIVVVAAMLVAAKEIPLYNELASSTPTMFKLTMEQHYAKWCGFFAVMLASINVFGGFVVTRRMLAMFKSKKEGK